MIGRRRATRRARVGHGEGKPAGKARRDRLSAAMSDSVNMTANMAVELRIVTICRTAKLDSDTEVS